MKKGFALNWVLSNDGRTPLFGARDLQALADSGATVARFELRVGSAPEWTDDLIGRYAEIARQLSGAGISPIGLIYADAVPGARQADWNVGNAETVGGTGDTPFARRFADLARRLAAALPEISLWEIWNEPNAWRQQNGRAYSGGSFIYPSNFAAVLIHAGAAIKSVQPAATIISGGLLSHNNHGVLNTQNSGADYLNDLYSALKRLGGGTLPFDGIGQHLYVDQPGQADPDHLWQYISHMQAIAQRNEGGAGRPLYITEAAWTTTAVAPELQAVNLRTMFEVCERDAQVAAVCWFQIRDNPPGKQFFGVCAPDWSRKPAFAAFQAI
ncbi:MAG TPA: hypothetical protein VNL35_19505 [Chloroflexota bacterium]|nr:hypothetical protein [Chloroflexota bacterium]